MVAIFVNSDELTIDDICKFLKKMGREVYIDDYLIKTFDKYDTDLDNVISINQFYSYVADNQKIWESIFELHESFVKYFFPRKHYINILNRMINKRKIFIYVKRNGGKFPQEKCTSSIVRTILALPPVYKYDFYSHVDINYYMLVNQFIFENLMVKFENQIFYKKHLQCYTDYPISHEIDEFFSKSLDVKSKSLAESHSSKISRHGSTLERNSARLKMESGKQYKLIPTGSNKVISISRSHKSLKF